MDNFSLAIPSSFDLDEVILAYDTYDQNITRLAIWGLPTI